MGRAEQVGLEQVGRGEPEPGRRLPLEETQAAISAKGAVILLVFARLLRRFVQDEIRSQPAGIAQDSRDSLGPPAQDESDKRGFG
jgi:hypothetical protein